MEGVSAGGIIYGPVSGKSRMAISPWGCWRKPCEEILRDAIEETEWMCGNKY